MHDDILVALYVAKSNEVIQRCSFARSNWCERAKLARVHTHTRTLSSRHIPAHTDIYIYIYTYIYRSTLEVRHTCTRTYTHS
jgi:hypothetical protein